jgi:hypothetical protein
MMTRPLNAKRKALNECIHFATETSKAMDEENAAQTRVSPLPAHVAD